MNADGEVRGLLVWRGAQGQQNELFTKRAWGNGFVFEMVWGGCAVLLGISLGAVIWELRLVGSEGSGDGKFWTLESG
jgi:hypothetical protein